MTNNNNDTGTVVDDLTAEAERLGMYDREVTVKATDLEKLKACIRAADRLIRESRRYEIDEDYEAASDAYDTARAALEQD
jgi:type IV secretory pathway VirB4 component